MTDKHKKSDVSGSNPETLSYTEAFAELQAIIAEIEGGEISVDRLAEKVKRAAMLIHLCKDKLTATEGDVNAILRELESDSAANGAAVS